MQIFYLQLFLKWSLNIKTPFRSYLQGGFGKRSFWQTRELVRDLGRLTQVAGEDHLLNYSSGLFDFIKTPKWFDSLSPKGIYCIQILNIHFRKKDMDRNFYYVFLGKSWQYLFFPYLKLSILLLRYIFRQYLGIFMPFS